MNHKELTGESIRESFEKFNKENPLVYDTFKQMALNAIQSGRDKLSSKLIINVIRWEYYLKTDDQNFKINDSFTSYYARHFIAEFPHHADKFATRKLRNEEDAPYMTVDEKGQYAFL